MHAPHRRRFERLRVLWSFARPHARGLAAGLALALVGSAMALATPMVTKWVLDTLDTSSSLTEPVAVLVAVFLVGAVIWYRQWALLGTLGERVVLEARESMVRRFLRATIPAIAARPPGELVTRVTSDTLLLREAASSSVVGLINGTVLLVGTLVLMAVLDLVLLATTVAAVLVVGALFAVLMPALATAQERAQEHVGRLGGTLEGALRAIRTVKASLAEERLGDRILADATASTEHSIRAVRREAFAWTVAWSGIQLAIILILAIGAWRVSEGLLEVSSLIAFLLYAFGLMEPITELTQNTTALQSGIAAAGRIREVDALAVEDDGAPPRPAMDPLRDGPILELRDVTASYGPALEPALAGVSLAIPRRGHLAIVGPSGAGKTTLFSLLLRFLEPQGGALYLDGRPYAGQTHADVRARLAYVEQETPVVPGTIRDNVVFAQPDATDEDVGRVLAQVRLERLADGLDAPLGTASVSGGERQRIALARALLRAPDVLLLDEATAQVDGLTEAAIHDCIRERAATSAVVTIAHRLSTVVDADTIVVMDAGRIRTWGDHRELLASDDLYRDLVEALRIGAAAGPSPRASASR